jgi:large subunit ribosomal protein L6
MKKKILETIEAPTGIECSFANNKLTVKKGAVNLEKKIYIPSIDIRVKENKIVLESKKGNKNDFKKIYSSLAHIRNMFKGVENKFEYNLEACNVHFPMTLKVDKGYLIINNFLGEKVPRKAKILPNVNVDVKGQKIVISSHDIEAAGATATNIEKSTHVKNRDRRVFQDGIFIVGKPGGKS